MGGRGQPTHILRPKSACIREVCGRGTGVDVWVGGWGYSRWVVVEVSRWVGGWVGGVIVLRDQGHTRASGRVWEFGVT